MEIVTNEIRKQTRLEISRQMDTKMRSERSALCNMFVIICLFIPFFMITLLKNAVVSLKRKVYDFFQSELKKFNEIHGDNTTSQQYTDPAFIAYIKGEDQVPAMGFPQKTTETDEGRRFQKTTQQTNKCTNKIKKNKSTSKKRNKRMIKIQPPPVEELVLKGSIGSFCRLDKLAPTSTPDVAGQVPSNINVESLAGDRNMCCCKHTSAPNESNKRSNFYLHFLRIVNGLVDLLLFVPQTIYAYVQRELELFNDIHQDSIEVLPYTEPAFIAYLKGEEAAPFIKSPHIIFSPSGSNDFSHSPLSPSSPGKKQLATPPTVGQQSQVRVPEIVLLSSTHSKNDFVTSSPDAHMGVFAQTPPVQEKAKGKVKVKGKVMAPLTLSCHTHHQIRTPGNTKDHEHSSSGVTHSSQVCSANLTGDSQDISSCEINGKSSAKEQDVVEPTTHRVKQIKNEEEFELISYWNDHAPIGRTQNKMSASGDVSLNVMVADNITRKQRNAERSIQVSSKDPPTEFVARQTRQDIRQSAEAIAEEPQFIEVVPSVLSAERLSTGHPEVMETDGEQFAVTISFGEPVEAKQQSETANASFNEVMEPMELDQGQCENEILFVQKEAMETNQECVSEDSSFRVWEGFVQPFFAPLTEEMMETDQEPSLATPSHAHQLEPMETTYELADACTPVAIPFEETDAKRPLSSTVRVLQEKSMLMKTPFAAEQGLTQSVTKSATVCMAPATEQCCMQRDASIYNEHSQEMEFAEPFNNGPNFAVIKPQMTAAAETYQLKSTNQLTMEQQQLEHEVCYFSDALDSDSDDDSDGEYDLGLGEQVLRIIELLA